MLFRGCMATLIGFTLSASVAVAPDAPDVFEEFKAVCLDWHADPVIAERIALERGYEPAGELVPDDLFQGQGLNVWVKVEGGVEYRVLTKEASVWGYGGGTAPQDRCYLSAEPGDHRPARRAVGRYLGQSFFRQKDTSVFAWIDTPEGREPVRRATFERVMITSLTERGMQMVLVRQHQRQTMLAYLVPREE